MDHPRSGVPRSMPFHLLEEITDGFSKERELGSGAFGKVYMGIHQDGAKIAVKMLRDIPGLEEDQFLNEFNNLARLQHQNIVRIVGYCHETRKEYLEYNGRLLFAERIHRLLCFEYMHYGSLDKYLSDEHHGLDWNTRYKIIKGVCLGLKYLHEELETPIYHLDLKPANILLDENMVPKIADFGLSRFFGDEKTQITTSFIGTWGYLPPEYIERNVISNKFDIFSLGVVTIKIMTGPGYSKSADMPLQQFAELVHESWRSRLQKTQLHMLQAYAQQVKKCIEIALGCVEADRRKRPSIGNVVKALNETETLIHKTFHQITTPPFQFQAPQSAFAQDTLQQRVKAVIEGFGVEAWTYGIFWQLTKDAASGSSILGWGDGYYKGCPEKEHRELNALICDEEEISDNMWSNLVSVMQSVLNGSDDVLGQEQGHRKRVFSKLKAVISRSCEEIADTEEVNDSSVPDQEQQHRKRVLCELDALISGADPSKRVLCELDALISGAYPSSMDSAVEEVEEVTDTEWFFLVSMTQAFASGCGLLGQVLLSAQPIWIANGLSGAPCERARQAYNFGFRTMVCVPIGNGVIELGSTDLIFQTTDSVAKILLHFNRPIKQDDVP